MEEKTAEGERDEYIIRTVFKYAKEIFKKLTIDILTMIMAVFVNFFFIAPCYPFSSINCFFKKKPPKSLPILRLPFLAIQEVVKAMDPIEIINFSMTSKRAKGITKQMTFYSRYEIGLCVNETLQIRFYGTNILKSGIYLTTEKRMDGKTAEDEDDGFIVRKLYNYSKCPVDEWKQLTKHVLEIFNRQAIYGLSMTMDAFVDQNVSIIDFLKTNVKSIEECNLYQRDRDINVDEHAAYLLDNLKVTADLKLFLHIKNVNFNGKISKNLTELYIYSSQWIGYERLIEIDSKSVVLKRNLISEEEWNVFFKKWIAMEINQNLRSVQLGYRELDQFRNRVLHDIPHEVVGEDVSRIVPCRYNEAQEIRGGIDIRRIDGKTATFFVLRTTLEESFYMSVY